MRARKATVGDGHVECDGRVAPREREGKSRSDVQSTWLLPFSREMNGGTSNASGCRVSRRARAKTARADLGVGIVRLIAFDRNAVRRFARAVPGVRRGRREERRTDSRRPALAPRKPCKDLHGGSADPCIIVQPPALFRGAKPPALLLASTGSTRVWHEMRIPTSSLHQDVCPASSWISGVVFGGFSLEPVAAP